MSKPISFLQGCVLFTLERVSRWFILNICNEKHNISNEVKGEALTYFWPLFTHNYPTKWKVMSRSRKKFYPSPHTNSNPTLTGLRNVNAPVGAEMQQSHAICIVLSFSYFGARYTFTDKIFFWKNNLFSAFRAQGHQILLNKFIVHKQPKSCSAVDQFDQKFYGDSITRSFDTNLTYFFYQTR